MFFNMYAVFTETEIFRQYIKILTNAFKTIKHLIKIESVKKKMIIEIENKNKTYRVAIILFIVTPPVT